MDRASSGLMIRNASFPNPSHIHHLRWSPRDTGLYYSLRIFFLVRLSTFQHKFPQVFCLFVWVRNAAVTDDPAFRVAHTTRQQHCMLIHTMHLKRKLYRSPTRVWSVNVSSRGPKHITISHLIRMSLSVHPHFPGRLIVFPIL